MKKEARLKSTDEPLQKSAFVLALFGKRFILSILFILKFWGVQYCWIYIGGYIATRKKYLT